MIRALTFAREQPYYHCLVETLFANMWAIPKKMDEPDVLDRVLRATGLPADDILAGLENRVTKTALIKETTKAVDLGVF